MINKVTSQYLWRSQKCIHHFTAAHFVLMVHGENSILVQCALQINVEVKLPCTSTTSKSLHCPALFLGVGFSLWVGLDLTQNSSLICYFPLVSLLFPFFRFFFFLSIWNIFCVSACSFQWLNCRSHQFFKTINSSESAVLSVSVSVLSGLVRFGVMLATKSSLA